MKFTTLLSSLIFLATSISAWAQDNKPSSPKGALDIAVNASKKAAELKKLSGVWGNFGTKDLEEKFKKINQLHEETMQAIERASSTAEKVQLQNSFLEKKKELLTDAVSMIDAVMPKFTALSNGMQGVIGDFSTSSGYLKKADATKARLSAIKTSGKKLDQDIKLASTELSALDPSSAEYVTAKRSIRKLKLNRHRLIKEAERQLRQKQLYSFYIKDMEKHKDSIVKVREYTEDTAFILEVQKEDLVANIEFVGEQITRNEFVGNMSELGSVGKEIQGAVATMSQLTKLPDLKPIGADFEGLEPIAIPDSGDFDWDSID